MNNNVINVMVQAFYGNRTGTSVKLDEFDNLILGYPSAVNMVDKKIDRTIIKLVDDSELVLIYNKYEEEKRLAKKEKYLTEMNHVLKPVAFIPKENIEIYSRCVVCRMDENGVLKSLKDEDYDKIVKYLAE